MKKILSHILISSVFLICSMSPIYAGEWSGKIATEYKLFTESPTDPRQHGNNLSVAIEPEYYQDFADEQSLVVKVFARWDEGDEERTHSDVREFLYQKVSDNWELKAGIGKVYWGVTESQHLVDIINQTDLVENIDQEEKLGQTLINLTLIQDWATVDLFVLPTFRERTFPGVNGRLRAILPVDTSQAQYESNDRDKHVDYAVRFFSSFDEWVVGFNVFTGTSRDPRFNVGLNNNNELVLIPFYDLITQTGLDVQGTFDSWLWKMELIHREGQGAAYSASTAGFEYTFYGVFESDTDIGFIMEYLYDERGTNATTPFDNDVLIGTRFALNDTQSTDLLIGFIADLDDHNPAYTLEASRRLTDHFKLNIEARIFNEKIVTNPSYAFRNDDYMQLELEYYF